MAYVYNEVNWEDTPSTNTPRNATNLGNMDTGIKENNNMLNGTKPMGSIVVDDVKCKNMFRPTLYNNGTAIIQSNAVGSLNLSDDEFTFVASGSDMYFGQLANNGVNYTDDRGILIDVENLSTIAFTITNNLFNRVYITAYNSSKVSLGYTVNTSNTGTYTIPTGAKYISIRFGKNDAVSGTTYKTKVQVEAGDTPSSYTPYKAFGAESGSGYFKYDDGTMICYGSFTKSTTCSTALTNGGYRNSGGPSNYVEFPVEFASVPTVIVDNSTLNCIGCIPDGINTSNFTALFTTINSESSATSKSGNYIAIGKWK